MFKILLHVGTASILTASTLQQDIYIDTKPSAISKQDLILVRDFDKLAYELAEQVEMPDVNIASIVNYIWRNRDHVEDYTRLKLDGLGSIGYRTPRGADDNQALINEKNYNYYKIGLALTYNLYDGKTSKDIQNKKLEYRAKIIMTVEKYATCKNDLTAIEINLKMKRLAQIRSKVMVKTAQKYLDDRLKVIEEIMKLKIEADKKTSACKATKLQLLNMVTPASKSGLEELL